MATKIEQMTFEVEIPDCENCSDCTEKDGVKAAIRVLQREIDYYESNHSDYEMLKGLNYAKKVIEREFLR